eukprot:Gb_03583 [translate_table: standard]
MSRKMPLRTAPLRGRGLRFLFLNGACSVALDSQFRTGASKVVDASPHEVAEKDQDRWEGLRPSIGSRRQLPSQLFGSILERVTTWWSSQRILMRSACISFHENAIPCLECRSHGASYFVSRDSVPCESVNAELFMLLKAMDWFSYILNSKIDYLHCGSNVKLGFEALSGQG